MVSNNRIHVEKLRSQRLRIALFGMMVALLVGAPGSQSTARFTHSGPEASSAPARTAGLLVPKRVRLIIGYQRTALV